MTWGLREKEGEENTILEVQVGREVGRRRYRKSERDRDRE